MFETIMIVVGIALLVGGLVFARIKTKQLDAGGSALSSYQQDSIRATRWVGRAAAIVGAVLALLFGLFSTVYTQGVGEAKVFVDASGKVVGSDLDPGFGVKAPWVSAVDFDLFSQEVLYAGGDEGAPSYSGGTVSGKEVTVSVGGINGGSTQANVDISVVYSLDAEQVEAIYKDWRGQERFTKSVIERTILSTVREIPSSYSAIEFRGEKRGEAADRITESLAKKLEKKGVTDFIVNIQDVRYSQTVQDALNAVENAAQEVQKAEEEQRKVAVEADTAKIKAEGEAQAAIARANGEAEANRLIAASLTPEVLAKLQIDAYDEGSIFTIPEGSTPFVQTGR
jgi:regulator of protease activity HflC (stomatin/prohibitin superfamily)